MENFDTIHYMTSSINEERHTTNVYCRNFFFFVCVIWVGCWIPVIFTDTTYSSDISVNRTLNGERHPRIIRIDCKDSAKRWNILDCSPYPVYSAIYADMIKPNNTVNCKKEKCCNDPGLNPALRLFFYIFTIDPTYLADCKDEMFPAYFIATGLTCTYTLSCAIFWLLNDKKILKKQPLVTAAVFVFVVLIEHSSELLISFVFPKLWPYDGRLVYWLVPEAITIAIMLLKMVCSTSGSNNNRREKDLFTYKIIPFNYYTYAMVYGFSFVYILKFFVSSTMIALHKTGSTNIFYLLIVLCSYIMCHTIYYVGIMSTSYATYIWMDQKKFHPKDLWHAFYIISRYHCGTACKHVIPKLAKSETYNRGKTKLQEYGYTKDSDPERYEWLRTKSSKHYRLSRVLTATRGYNWSDTISMVSHLVITTSTHKYFSSFGEYKQIIYGILMSTNFLTHFLLWHFGVFNTKIAEATWFMYLTITLAFNLVMQFFKAASDTIGLCVLRQELLNRRFPQMHETASTEEV